MATLADIARVTTSLTQASPTIDKIRVFPTMDNKTFNAFGFSKAFPNERILLASFTMNPDRQNLLRRFIDQIIPVYRDSRTNKLKRIADAITPFINPTLL